MKQLTNRQLQAKQTKQKLLDVSMDLIRKHGFDSVSIQQICEAAGVSTGAFYHHLGSKSGIVVEIYLQCDEYFESEVINNLTGETYYDMIIEYIEHQLIFAEDNGVDLLIPIYKAQITEGNEFFLMENRGLTKGLLHLVEKAQLANELTSQISHKQIGKELLIISRGVIYNWCQSEGKYQIVPLGKKMIRNYLSAYKI